MRPPIGYFGAKVRTAARIVAMLPPHVGYIEPFAGSLAVLLEKPPSRVEVVNDLDRRLMTFWRVLRDRGDELVQAAALTPHSRAEFEACTRSLDTDDELELARRVWVCLTQGRSQLLDGATSWKFFADPGSDGRSYPERLDTYRGRLAESIDRLRHVSLECRPALTVIDQYGASRHSLLYVDPPYLGELRSRRDRYSHEMRSEQEHRELADHLHACEAAVVLSGYASPLYDRDLFPDWDRHELKAFSGHGEDRDRTEVLWSNRDLTAALFTLEREFA